MWAPISSNKKIVEQYLRRTKRSDVAPLLAEDAEWVEYAEGVPESGVVSRGRTAWLQNLGDTEVHPEIHRLTEENNVVVVEGTARGTQKEGGNWTVRLVDIFELANEKIQRMTSFGPQVQ